MRKVSLLMAMVLSVALLSGCQGRTGTMLGMALGGGAGGVVPAVVKNASPALSTIAPIAGAALGGGLGLWYDMAQEKKAAEAQQVQQMQAQQMQLAQAQQAQLAELKKTMKLSVPVGVIVGPNGYQARNGAELAEILFGFQLKPGNQFGLMVNPRSIKTVAREMAENGFVQIPGQKKVHERVLLTFQVPGGQTNTPMALDQIAKML